MKPEHDTERLLHDALAEKAERDIPSDRTVPVFAPTPSAHREVKPGWAIPLLAAASVTALIAGVFGTQHLLADRTATPADSSSRALTTANSSPTATPTPSLSPLPTTPPSTKAAPPPPNSASLHVSPSETPTTSASATPPPTNVTVGGIRMTIPGGWRVLPNSSFFRGPNVSATCIVDPSGACALEIAGDNPSGANSETFDANSELKYGTTNNCVHRTEGWASIVLGGRTTSYRKFAAACTGQTAAEQWVASTSPTVAVWHPTGVQDAAVHHILETAQLPAQAHPLPLHDKSVLSAITRAADGWHLTFQPLVLPPDDPFGTIIGVEPDAWSIVVPVGTQFACTGWKVPGYPTWSDWCTGDILAKQATKGSHPSDGSLALNSVPVNVFSDGTGVSAAQLYRDSQDSLSTFFKTG